MEEACQGNLPVNPLNLPTRKSFMLIWCNLAEVVQGEEFEIAFKVKEQVLS